MITRFLNPILTFTVVCSLSLCIHNCKKDKPTPIRLNFDLRYDSLGLPIVEPDRPDAYVMGCLVNGQIWIPEGGNFLEGPFNCDIFARTEPDSASGGELNANKILNNGTNEHFHLTLPRHGFRLGNFGFADWNPVTGMLGFDAYYIDYSPIKPNYICSMRDSANSIVTITHFDFEKQYIAGTFQMTMYRVTTNGTLSSTTFAERDQYLDFTDSLVITNGRFGMHYRPN